ncbi:hypothetical protein NP493_3356g00001 [Ridgeia piscesae]|uniref:Uncharacterized protein n=1 Tax=Ridgeia piscesae TaxID=27915 RepID=A0AAD9MW29_RIDPI|nr:hypothetical protein NP493_3356g00001 [Ridgeia piscesae]
MELAKYNNDIAALCETRFSESGSLSDLEYSFFRRCKPEGERTEAGVGFAIKMNIVTKCHGQDNDKWPLVVGKRGIGKCNSNGELLLALCSAFELIVTNTMFKQKDERKTTWMHPRSGHWHMNDFIITRRRRKAQHQTRNGKVVYNTAKTYLGKPDRKHQDWFDTIDQELQTLMSRK